MDLSTFATMLRVHRRRIGLTQPQAAALIGVSTRLWSECERAARPNVSLNTALQMLDVLGIDLDAREKAVAPHDGSERSRGATAANDPQSYRRAAESLQHAIARLYPEQLDAPVDLEKHARSVIVRVMNTGPDALRETLLAYYGYEHVATVLRAAVNRLDTPVYDAWRTRMQLPNRSSGATAVHRLWRR